MLTESAVTTMLPVRDAIRASQFYADTLGLRKIATAQDGTCYFEAGHGDAIGLRPLPNPVPSQNTAMSFEVSDIEAEVSELERRGAEFQDFDSGELRTVNHIATLGDEKAAWFTDTEGNILCLHQVTE
ncbi:MAG TPA: VOC family protein [Amycolatopsis sp.]|uniref:VOC family protein n=1 Tax=Amycolatopsis sp. TaxID=37632 RepID=UPI002B475C5E|nr:VOC family protein [Amycolatopsis sp.]HKS46955.1 VOC family protein [Amycolatopsis sp.]